MSRPPEYENGMYGVYAAHGAPGTPGAYDIHGGIQPADAPEASPNVYHPQAESSPVYEAYADPAAAHGWQNAYDETTELPPVADGAHGAVGSHGAGGASVLSSAVSGGGYDYVYETGYDYGDDFDAGRDGPRSHRGRHQPGVWRSRRVAVAAGAVGAVSVAALIAGFFLSGSSSEGGAQIKRDRTGPTVGDPAEPTVSTDGEPAPPGSPDAARPSRAEAPDVSVSPSGPDADAVVDDEKDKKEEPSTEPSVTTDAPSTPTATASGSTAPGNSGDNPGRGQGNPKDPK